LVIAAISASALTVSGRFTIEYPSWVPSSQ
jgi:hypothetical protein